MSATAVNAISSNNVVVEKLKEGIEYGRTAVSNTRTAVETPVKEAIETVSQQVRARIETGRDAVNSAAEKTQQTIRATRERSQKMAEEGKQRLRDVAVSATSYVGGTCAEGEVGSEAAKGCYAARVFAVVGGYVQAGRKVLSDARTSVNNCQHAAVETVHNTIAHGRRRVETYATTAKDSVEYIVGTGKGIVQNSTRRLSEARTTFSQQATFCVETVSSIRDKVTYAAAESKPRLALISATGRRAVTERDVRLAITTFAQVVAGTIQVMTAALQLMFRLECVKRQSESARNFLNTNKTWQSMESVNVRQTVERVPVVGHYFLVAATTFVDEVKKNMGENVQKEC